MVGWGGGLALVFKYKDVFKEFNFLSSPGIHIFDMVHGVKKIKSYLPNTFLDNKI